MITRASLGIVCAVFLSAVSNGQTWQTMDDFGPASSAKAVITSPSAGTLVTGTMRDGDTRWHAIIRRSVDGGSTWDTCLDIPSANDPSAPLGSGAGFSALAEGNFGIGIVAVGRVRRVYRSPGVLTGEWLVVRSVDGGNTWETLDTYFHPTYDMISGENQPNSVAVGEDGAVWVCGSAYEQVTKGRTTTTVPHWLIRKGQYVNGAWVWSTSDFAFPTTGQLGNVTPKAILCVGSQTYVAGCGSDNGLYWTVLRTNDGGGELVNSRQVQAG